VLDYVFQKYGLDRAAMISNHVGFRARAAVREIAKVYGLPEAEIKAVTQRMGYYWSIRNLPDFVQHDPVYKDMEFKDPWPEILRLAVRLEGYPRNMSVHCGGVVIVPAGSTITSRWSPPPRGCGSSSGRKIRRRMRVW